MFNGINDSCQFLLIFRAYSLQSWVLTSQTTRKTAISSVLLNLFTGTFPNREKRANFRDEMVLLSVYGTFREI